MDVFLEIIEGLSIAVWGAPAGSTRLNTASSGIEHLLGVPPQDLLGRDLFEEFGHPEERGLHQSVRDLEPGRTMTLEHRLRHPRGHWVWVRNRCGRNASGEALRGALTDITEEVRARRRADELERDLREATDLSGAIFFSARGDQATFVSSAYERVTGRPRPKDGAFFPEDLIDPDDRERITRLRERIRASGALTTRTRFRILRPDGEKRWVSLLIHRVEAELPGVYATYGLAQDITEELQEEDERRHGQRLESLGTVAGSIAHDFNNILVSILGNAVMARGDVAENSDLGEMLDDVIAGAERGSALCRQILTFSGRGVRGTRGVSPFQAIQRLLPLLNASHPTSTVLELQHDPARRYEAIKVDPTQFDQVIMNLVLNACEAIGSAPGRVRIRFTELKTIRRQGSAETNSPEQNLGIVVEDSGPGISEEARERLFEPFFSTKQRSGRGLGLSSVFGIVRAHKGLIEVGRSEELGGAQFTVWLPISAEEEPERAGPSAAPVPQQVATRRVLIVDDNQGVLRTAERVLEGAGHKTLTAGSLWEAEEAKRGFSPDLVLLDQSLEDGEGIEWFETWREQPGRPAVIISSGRTRSEIEPLVQGVERLVILPKPYPPADLLRAVADLAST